ncbi:MAG: DUF1315 family protein [Halioglobus sp.]|nr:DUF1315 family protein [Halioglobus sp.]
MDYMDLIETMTPEVYRTLVRSVEIGKWPDGNALTAEQRENAMQAIIAWGELHLPEQERVGYISPKDGPGGPAGATPLKWRE